ncbi:unnamed protein product [Coffea canephora]|uniref:DH200=94 genomic scaffold, scaffold_163 n=1 Tax=Coffea canephora TaxID=49390 RepID=A0A068VA73_COFCA|nr:unnamed protein product [Coffea canephora]
MSGKKKRKSEVDNWLKDVKKLSPEIDALETRGSSWRLPLKEDPVGKLQLQVKELIQQSHHFNGLVLDAYDNIGEPCLPTKLFGEKFKQNLERTWPCLVIDDISSIGIYGMGGVGKTTLAQHIKYYLSKNTNYQVLWVTVSQEFSINSLQDKIANVLGFHLSNKDEEQVRADILRGAFRKMKRLIVLILDDVWQEFCLDKVGIPLDARSCRLILTTRSLEVCNRMRCQRKFDLKTLDTNEAWDLFKYKLGSETLLHGDVEDITKSVVKRCAGLPLGIITVAGSMQGVGDISEWRNALEQLKACSVGHDEIERDVFPILEWSFNRLNECLKHCFLYCSLYPEDSEIERKELIELFIRAELMPKRKSRSEEFDQGHTILNKLIKVCLLEETTDFSGNDYVKMHDLVRDMALRITSGNSKKKMSTDVPWFLVKRIEEGNSRVTLEQKEWTEDLHVASLYGGDELKVPLAWSPNCPKLSILLLDFPWIERIPDSFFMHMSGLKVLHLSNSELIGKLPNCVSDMVSLTALVLTGCQGLDSLPPLGKLKQLRELDLSWTDIQDLPQGLESLINLEWLNLNACSSLIQKIIPKETFTQFHHLQLLISGLDGIEFLLQFFFAPTPCDQLEVSSFSPLQNLQALKLNNLPNLVGLFYWEIEAYFLPLGIFSSLTKLWISYCHNMKQLFTMQLLQNLKNLEDLEIRNCEGLKEIAADNNGVGKGGKEGIQLTSSEATTTIILPKLKRLHLTWLPQLKNICTAAMICNSITEIEMFGCPKVKRLPLFLLTINGLPFVPSTLHKIRGDKEWWESLEWENPSAKNALDPFFTTTDRRQDVMTMYV